MITIEQIKKLDQKVQAAVNRISALTSENATLQDNLQSYQKRISELEVLIERFKKDQSEIENGNIRALEQLDQLEDSMDATPEASETDSDEDVDEESDDKTAASTDAEPMETEGESADVEGEPSGEPNEAPDAETEAEESDPTADKDEEELDIF